MSDLLNTAFQNRKVNVQKLLSYGFQQAENGYVYQSILQPSGFILTVQVTPTGQVSAVIMDPAWNEPYTLHLADGATGSFVGGIKLQYETLLQEIAAQCFEPDCFKTPLAKRLISFVRERYGNELEFLWAKFPNNAIWRRDDNGKWYAALLTISKRKLGLNSDEVVEIIDLRALPGGLASLIDHKKYHPGYHMNKKHWYTIMLDGSVPYAEICQRLQESHRIAGGK